MISIYANASSLQLHGNTYWPSAIKYDCCLSTKPRLKQVFIKEDHLIMLTRTFYYVANLKPRARYLQLAES